MAKSLNKLFKLRLNYKPFLYVLAIAIILGAAYISVKQGEGFQSNLLRTKIETLFPEVFAASGPPAWVTLAQKNALMALLGNASVANDQNLIAALTTANTASVSAGDPISTRLDKVLAAGNTYITSSSSSAPPPAIGNSATLDALFSSINSVPGPAWYTQARKDALMAAGELVRNSAGGGPSNTQYQTAINKVFSDSKAAGDKDDVTFDKLINGMKDYANAALNTVSNSATFDALFNSISSVPGPAWYTQARKDALMAAGELLRQNRIGDGPDSANYQTAINKIFSDSKAAGDKDDVTFDKLINGMKDYANAALNTVSNSKTYNELMDSLNKMPKWFTQERKDRIVKIGELSKKYNLNPEVTEKEIKPLLEKAFKASKDAGEKDDVTFDKLMKVHEDYLDSKAPLSTTAIAVGATAGVATLGTIGYFFMLKPV